MAKRKLPIDLATATLPQLQEYLQKAEDTTYVLELAVTLRSNPEIEADLTSIVAYIVDLKSTLKLLKAQAPNLSAVEVEAAKARLRASIAVNESKAKALEGSTELRMVNLRKIYLQAVENLTAQLATAGLPAVVVELKKQYLRMLDLLTQAAKEWKEAYPTLALEEMLPEVASLLPDLFGKKNDEAKTSSGEGVSNTALQQGVTGG